MTAEGKSQKYLKWTKAERQMIVAKYQQLWQFLEGQERLLLAQLQKLDEEIVRRLSMQISRLSEWIGELEGTCQKPASEFLQDVRSTLSRLQYTHVCLQLSPWPAEPGTGNGRGRACELRGGGCVFL